MDNPLEQLYNKFRKELSSDDISLYYDEGDIADIFDYAGDVRDDYVRLEALLLGNRLYPDSELMLDRRAIWLSNLSNEALRSFIQDHPRSNPSMMWEILHIRANAPYTTEQAVGQLDALIDRFRLVDDESIIQFVALVRHLEQEEWLIANIDRVRDRCDSAPTLLFEIARLAENKPQSSSAIPLLEELTELDPFNTDYWGLMAELQSNCEQFEESLASLEYAKALEPDDVELLTIEGYNYLRLGRVDEAVNALQHALTIDSDYYVAKRNLLEACRLKGDSARCADLARQLFAADPADKSLLVEMLISFPDETDETLSHHYACVDADENDAIAGATELCRLGREDAALNYLQWYGSHYTLSDHGNMVYIELLYHNGRYREAYDYIIDNLKSPVISTPELPVIAVIVSILLKLHIFDEALHFTNNWLEKLRNTEISHNAFNLVNRGLIELLVDVRNLLTVNPVPTEEQIERVTL